MGLCYDVFASTDGDDDDNSSNNSKDSASKKYSLHSGTVLGIIFGTVIFAVIITAVMTVLIVKRLMIGEELNKSENSPFLGQQFTTA